MNNWLFDFLGSYIIPSMIVAFFVAILLRMIIYYIVHSESLFVDVFSSNVKRYMNKDYKDALGLRFDKLAEYLLNRSHFEYFDLRRLFKRRRGDMAMNFLDRLFLFELGTGLLIEDTIKKTRYHHKGNAPDFDHVSRHVYSSNPYYNRIFGLAPIQLIDDLINILPGLFIVGGILGTFVGIMIGIPELKAIDVTNTNETQKALEGFLSSMAYAMGSSIVGISLSVMMNLINTSLSAHAKYVNLVDNFKDSLKFIWNEAMLQKECSEELNSRLYGADYFRERFNQNVKEFTKASSRRAA